MKQPIIVNIKSKGGKIKNHVKILSQLKNYNGPVIIRIDNVGSICKLSL